MTVVSPGLDRPRVPLGRSTLRLVGAAATIGLFFVAVQLLGAATDAAAPTLERVLYRVVVDDSSALGLGWLGAYALANGSVIAALALSLFASGLLSAPQLFLMVGGSRLGGAAVVVFVGVLDFLGKDRHSLPRAVDLGLLTFLLTLSIYLPATAVGYVSLPHVRGAFVAAGRGVPVGLRPPAVLGRVTTAVTVGLGPGPSFLLAVALLFGSLKLFDRILAGADTETLRRRFFGRLRRTWLAFGLGLLVTGATTSVAFSLGVIVPLYNRGYVERDELVPYVLGANLGTLVDTLVVAAVLGSAVGVAVVLLLLVVAGAVTLVALFAYDRYGRAVIALDDLLLDGRRAFVLFVALLVAVPLGLLLVPLALR